MTDDRPTEPAAEDRRETKRPWSDPTLEVTPIASAEGPSNGFPLTDAVTGVS